MEETEDKTKCEHEFNSGFVTALALFYAHHYNIQIFQETDKKMKEKGNSYNSAHLVLYGATDHLYDLKIPEQLSDELKMKIKALLDFCFKVRMEFNVGYEIPIKAFEMCKEILMDIDREVFKQKHVCIKYP